MTDRRTICYNSPAIALLYCRRSQQKMSQFLRSVGEQPMRHVRDVGYAMILLCGWATAVFAQGTGDIVGRVSDASGGVLPGVTVTATSRATNISRTTVTSETGDY